MGQIVIEAVSGIGDAGAAALAVLAALIVFRASLWGLKRIHRLILDVDTSRHLH